MSDSTADTPPASMSRTATDATETRKGFITKTEARSRTGTFSDAYAEGYAKGYAEGFAEGYADGFAVGRDRAEVRFLCTALTFVFGPIPPADVDRIRAADSDQRTQWLCAALGARTLDDIFER